MSFIGRLWTRLVTHPASVRRLHVDHLTFVTCYDCGKRFYEETEFEAALLLSKHSILTHSEPPATEDEIAQAQFRSELRERIYGDR